MTEPPYTNIVHLQGKITSAPTVKALNQRTSLTAFQVSVIESWLNGDGSIRERKNRIHVEVVGKHSAKVAMVAKLGSWVTIEGYIRSEQFKGQNLTKVRTLAIEVWETGD